MRWYDSYSVNLPLLILIVIVGMYSKAAWGGPVDPFILTVFPNDTLKADEDPIVSLIIFEWKDQDLIGAYPNAEAFTVCAIDTDNFEGGANGHFRRSGFAMKTTSKPIFVISLIWVNGSWLRTRPKNQET